MKIQSCIACGKCAETGNCVLPDGLDEIIEKIRYADGFIPAAPVYFGTARGDIMVFIAGVVRGRHSYQRSETNTMKIIEI